MKKVIGILVVVFLLTLGFAVLIPDQRDLGPVASSDMDEELVLDKEISAFNHIEYSLLDGGRYLAVLDPGGFEGDRHGGYLTIFDTFNGAVVERFDNVSGFAPVDLDAGVIIFSARTGLNFSLFSYDLEDGLSSDLGIQTGQGGVVFFENGEVYVSNNKVSRNYIKPSGPEDNNFFGASAWARLDYSDGELLDSIDGLIFELDEVYPKIARFSDEESLIVEANNVTLLSNSNNFVLRVNR